MNEPDFIGKQNILIVDDDEDFGMTVSDIINHLGYNAIFRNNPVEALELLDTDLMPVDLILLDIIMPQMDGIEVLRRVVQKRPDVPVVMVTGQAYNVEKAIEAGKGGALHFLAKDKLDLPTLKEVVRMALVTRSDVTFSPEIQRAMKTLGFVTSSPKMAKILEEAEKVARTTLSVLITGETGVGKEMVARTIHLLSERSDNVFVSVDCGTLSDTLLQSELFGHVKGAFTDAKTDKLGLFETANGGTIFLDEIGNTSTTFQQNLLNVLNNGKIRRVGDTREQKVDVRVISATNKNLEELRNGGMFREDLYYRLNKWNIAIPPLRERREDVATLATYLLVKVCEEQNLAPHYLTKSAIDFLRRQEWSGNVRELDNFISKIAIIFEQQELDHSTVAYALKAEPSYTQDTRPLKEQVNEFEKKLILKALQDNNYNQTRAAQQLGVERTNFIKKMDKHDIKMP
jgi:DNA-binding NtrC family response regulator